MRWTYALAGLLVSVLSFSASSYGQATKPLAIHVIDTEFGGVAANLTCVLGKLNTTASSSEDEFDLLSKQTTDINGRILEFLSTANFVPDTYRIGCNVLKYYNRRGVTSFFPSLQTTFTVLNVNTDYKIVIVLSPFGYNTYRGG